MKNQIGRLLALPLLLFILTASHLYADGNPLAAKVYVIHGIPGSDLGLPNELPVDVIVNGAAALTNFKYGDIAGPLTLDAGRYDIEVRVAQDDHKGPLAIANSFYLAATENCTIAAHLTEEGVPNLTKFVNDLRKLDASTTRLVIRHGAAAPGVNVLAVGGGTYRWFYNLYNETQRSSELRAGNYSISLYAIGGYQRVRAPLNANLAAGKVYFAYAVGSLKTGSFTIVVQALDAE
jgi:hypothetical protein